MDWNPFRERKAALSMKQNVATSADLSSSEAGTHLLSLYKHW